jgi:hypothetical protein
MVRADGSAAIGVTLHWGKRKAPMKTAIERTVTRKRGDE